MFMVIKMKENKRISIICFGITILFLFCSIVLKENEKLSLLYDISLGVFTGALLSFVTAIISYYTLKEEKIKNLKEQIQKDITKYIEILETIKYVFFKEKLEKELKENNVYNENEEWANSFIEINLTTMEFNIRRLKYSKRINIEQICKNIEELSKLKNKREYAIKFKDIKEKILKIRNMISFCGFHKMQDKISYKEVQEIIFVNEDNEGNIIDNDIEIIKDDIRQTKKVNILKKELENFLIQL